MQHLLYKFLVTKNVHLFTFEKYFTFQITEFESSVWKHWNIFQMITIWKSSFKNWLQFWKMLSLNFFFTHYGKNSQKKCSIFTNQLPVKFLGCQIANVTPLEIQKNDFQIVHDCFIIIFIKNSVVFFQMRSDQTTTFF